MNYAAIHDYIYQYRNTLKYITEIIYHSNEYMDKIYVNFKKWIKNVITDKYKTE